MPKRPTTTVALCADYACKWHVALPIIRKLSGRSEMGDVASGDYMKGRDYQFSVSIRYGGAP
jgi:hypothetical protein